MTQNYIERYWRDATPEDAIKEPPMVARFRINEKDVWSVDTLEGLDRSASFRWIGQHVQGQECQVYDAPDPGEGWRLVDVEKETKQEGDEYLSSYEVWKPAKSNKFFSNLIYRRRITPTVTYIPFTWEDREQLRGRWIKESDNVEIQVTAFHCNSKGVFYSEGRSAKVLVERWCFLDTGKPVGKEVTQ